MLPSCLQPWALHRTPTPARLAPLPILTCDKGGGNVYCKHIRRKHKLVDMMTDQQSSEYDIGSVRCLSSWLTEVVHFLRRPTNQLRYGRNDTVSLNRRREKKSETKCQSRYRNLQFAIGLHIFNSFVYKSVHRGYFTLIVYIIYM